MGENILQFFQRELPQARCRLVALNGPAELSNERLILGVKPTSKIRAVTSAFDPEGDIGQLILL